ncbi:hypothetical protein A1O1_07961 [Capronia coronata CBS 617.96]|uniref:Uncharacterized protein n=1 Tax=Capronia coronata CBS 617.96 TaxID=1182541 RepID=W9XY83_9EURO|nr:uncharacterized protein A1O1_07961 [Capronia coronata CBS 617.96]EXJ81896.1 hypothetical protein A1O1_07961 [Capronia coronata CBS 617.96]
MLGMARVVSPPPPSLKQGRVSLPPGVVTSGNGSGALAQAEDGTYIRGRFGPRASGHGIGGRSLEAHPIARTAQLSAIDEQVREIDKACEVVDRENAISQFDLSDRRRGLEHDTSFHHDSSEAAEAQPAIPTSPRGLSEDGTSSPAIYLSPPSTSPPRVAGTVQDESILPTQEHQYFDQPRLRSQRTLPHSAMRQGPGYAPSTLMALRSMESMPVLFSAAEEAERTRVRELVLEEKRREQRKLWVQMWCAAEDCCHDVWHLWTCASVCKHDHGRERSGSEW